MKKILATFVMMSLMTIGLLFSTAETANAQTRGNYRNSQTYSTTYNRPNVYQRHRNVFNLGIGTAAGTILGAIIGGRKGAVIGALAGAGGSALYTYKIKPKNNYYRRY